MNFQDKLVELDVCGESREWVGSRTLEQAWAECPRADWMLWLAAKVGLGQRLLVGASAVVTRDVMPIFEAQRPGDNRIRDCLDAYDRYAAGEDVDLGPYRRGAQAAAAAAATATCAAAAYAADAAKREAQARHADIVRKMIPVETIKELMK